MPVRATRTGTYNQSVGIKLDMDDAIFILTPSDVPLQQWLPTGTTSSIKVEWLDEELTPQTATATVVTGTGPWTITVADVQVFRPNDILHKVDALAGVQYVVDSINAGANTAVISAFAGNATAPVANDVLEIVGQYKNEGDDPEAPRSVDRTTNYNYTQIGQEQVAATRTSRKRELYGQGDPYDHEVEKKFKELAIRFERSLLFGQRAISGDSQKRFMGGLFYYITSNTASGTSANAKTVLNDIIRKCYEAGGSPSVALVSPAVKAAISANVDVSSRRSAIDETKGGSVIETFMSDFGELSFVVDRFMPKTKGLVLEKEYLERVNFDPYFHELLAKTGDSDKGEIVGEFTLKCKNEKAHGIFTLTDAA